MGRIVKKATDQARESLAHNNISLSDEFHININGRSVGREGGQPKAEITPAGELLVEDKVVAVTPAQRALLLQYRQHVIGLAEAGMEIGVQGADLGIKAAGEAIRGALGGDTTRSEQRVEVEAAKIEAAALKLCQRLPAMLATQQTLAASLPAFRPYATMDQSDIEECLDETSDGDSEVGGQARVQHEVRDRIRSSIRKSVQVVARADTAGATESQDASADEATESAPPR
ncbi:MAG: YggN family protein [Pseudomonadota bacterium]|nr:YggN family protein [Pseudomonadota bacterium]